MHVTTHLLLAASATTALALPARANSGDLVAPCFVCDRNREICYDAQGPSPSLNQSRRTSDERAERNLLRELSARPPVTTFIISNRTLCDLRSQT